MVHRFLHNAAFVKYNIHNSYCHDVNNMIYFIILTNKTMFENGGKRMKLFSGGFIWFAKKNIRSAFLVFYLYDW